MRARFVKSAAAMMAAACIAFGSGAPVMAAAEGSTTYFTNYLRVYRSDCIPDVSFTYTVSAGTPVSAKDNGGVPVLAGVDPDKVTIGSTTFKDGDDTVGIDDNIYASKVVPIDFSDVSFPDAGIYRYMIEENDGGDTEIGYDTLYSSYTGKTARIRYLDVYVTYDDAGTLAPASYLLHKTVSNDVNPENRLYDKSSGFYNTSEKIHYIAIYNEMQNGTAGDDSKLFLYHVSIKGALPGTTLKTSVSDLDTDTSEDAKDATLDSYKTLDAYKNAANPAPMKVAADGTASGDYMIRGRMGKNGTCLVIYGLPGTASVTVTEEPEDYTASVSVATVSQIKTKAKSDGSGYITSFSSTPITTGTTSFTTTMQTDNTDADDNLEATFTNVRNFAIPTGVKTGPVLIVALLVAACIAVIFAVKKRGEKA